VKSLYYCRSRSIQRADVVSNVSEVNVMTFAAAPSQLPAGEAPRPLNAGAENENDYEECLACQ